MHKITALTGLLLMTACAAPTPPHAVSTQTVAKPVQQGMYRANACKPADSRHNNCLCDADINAVQTGDVQVDKHLLRVAEHKVCPGVKTTAPEGVLTNQRKLDYEVTRDDAKWLSVVYTFYEMNAGAAHGMTTKEVQLYDKQNLRWIPQAELVTPAMRQGATKAVLDGLRAVDDTQYNGMLWPENIEHIFTEKGCEGCVLYPDADGWKVTFQPYTAGPYAVGLVTVPLDGGFVNAR